MLGDMQLALGERSYRGTAVFERSVRDSSGAHATAPEVEVLRIAHRVRDREVRERIEFLTGEPRELLRRSRDGENHMLCVFGESGIVLDGAAARAAVPRVPVPDGALEAYRLASADGGRQAGRVTRKITIAPRDGDRYGHRLWLDTTTSLPMRTETYLVVDGMPLILERFYYTAFDAAPELDDAQFESRFVAAGQGRRLMLRQLAAGEVSLIDASTLTPLAKRDAGERAAAATKRLRSWMPRGFLPLNLPSTAGLESGGKSPGAGAGPQWLYGDGLASISIFVESARTRRDVEHSHLGVMNATSLDVAGRRVTVVGDVPAPTIQRIASSVRLH